MPLIRPSRDEDIRAITVIYAHHVLHGTGSFETEAPSIADMTARRADVLSKGLPYLVVEQDRTGKLSGSPMAIGSSPARRTAIQWKTLFTLQPTCTAKASAVPCWPNCWRAARPLVSVKSWPSSVILRTPDLSAFIGPWVSPRLAPSRLAAGNSAPGAISSSCKKRLELATPCRRWNCPPHNPPA